MAGPKDLPRQQPPPVALFSDSSAVQIRALTSKAGLCKASNPITHSDMYTRTQHYVSTSTGHQQSNRAGGSNEGSTHWMKMRARKLQDQAAAKQTNLFDGVVVYINGYTGSLITNQELIRLLQLHGAIVSYTPSSKVTHTISTMCLSGKKTQKELKRKVLKRVAKLVTPAWVLDSIERERRQPERKYAVFEDNTQGDLQSLWAKK
ncbi:hypothetical protein K437DRAFT_220517 [Tilletiaria anomala UBC 951]|uniref:BRCT domain-containing protein n=1 Tax=Tilletiaria anomala (strain ATCC 24038 / CBS 436.72 / UBC 951) TaxID=1037660 RepID=A0A066WJ02_TILAU|nr:uncharacterized protein K437DRAFT_220517 [Tilletiaria anomala UBC 951]KDN52533.1 hypothetical protein K437DRAFT_220517 [Tilletiaria anomala UBC 951]